MVRPKSDWNYEQAAKKHCWGRDRKDEVADAKLVENIRTLDEESRHAIEQDREDLAKLALERKNQHD